ncbi:MAG: Flp pilus assembly complex ATPase component TadA [Microcystis sp. M054S2]|jgi:type IV pilus assembly protein PilB|uniref:Type II/IV secretion system protein n=1 Tax=Microcystis flos-aquae Mf_QC_C_20070823_S10D TaxID=2486236 RepID=A0A552L8I5_9CHRO|nr:GspE/PulE family protein [Microcystis sp. M054S2]TRT92789.1 MAG: type II/IV secretion system protein [Microcystis flos-aquae Ma_QC_C_20070823_S18D]TRV16526.1 MAG: type II/IV secretion system protein [Microcystis flos-aquae Mf_QC_C_20070823_S10D]TRV22890.1 MAG: type II/IV secretion system protein [Microcystis flos-aquae Mf_QC_C_20070823_S10]TRV35879.1 MAG: type II/IV secretion system protein [Microcystis flos-aquae Mf_QC_C_20070823_S20T]TRV39784.1 MAG: type II/IV secretion system protein [Mi
MSSANEKPQTNLPSFVQKLVQSGYITIPQLQKAIIQKQKSHLSLLAILPLITGRPLPKEALAYCRLEQLSKLKAKYGVEYLDPEIETIDWREIENLFRTVLPFEICRRYKILPLQKQQSAANVLHLAMVDPANQEILDDLRRILRDKELQFERRVIDRADYQKLVEIYRYRQEEAPSGHLLPQEQDLENRVDITDIFEDSQSLSHLNRELADEDLGVVQQANQGTIISVVNNILVQAIESKATEIHLEPQENQLTVRFRQDGLLRSAWEPISPEATPAIISRLKILANLDVSEKSRPQQGKMTTTFSGRKIDFRLHTLPRQQGEKILLRVFDSRSPLWPLDELITSQETCKLVGTMIECQAGLILLTAPARGGCSTSFYSLLAHRNRRGVNIATLETSIERGLNGITQVEIADGQGGDYASILPSFRNQDVDIIGIDRLADSSTLAHALEAALTGNLVISSLPLNDAFAAIARLNQLAEPALVADTLIGVINQRLVRRVCPVCRLKHQPKREELAKFGLSPAQAAQYSFYKANSLTAEEIIQAREKGRLCRHCHGIGYQSQIGVFEVITITPDLKTCIAENKSADMLKKAATQAGFKSLLAYGLELVGQGYTTLEEIERVMADQLTLPSLSAANNPEIPPDVFGRIEAIEQLLQALNRELQSLKREISLNSPTASPESANPTILGQELPDLTNSVLPSQNRSSDKEMIVSAAPVYEKLTDPGDWEQLKRELDANQYLIVSSEVNTSFPSVLDPWF